MTYDALLMLGLCFVAAFPVVVLSGGPEVAGSVAFRLYLAAVIAAYFVLSWRFGGQTLGMKAWRLRVVDHAGAAPSGPRALRRWLAALLSAAALGAGWLWMLIDAERRTWHDRLSGTRLVRTG